MINLYLPKMYFIPWTDSIELQLLIKNYTKVSKVDQ